MTTHRYQLRYEEGVTEEIGRRTYASARRIARERVLACDYGDQTSTIWVDVHIERRVGRGAAAEWKRVETLTIAVQPPEPRCTQRTGHVWREGRIRGDGGGVACTDTCERCGLEREDTTWATRPDDGTQGHAAIRYYAREVSA